MSGKLRSLFSRFEYASPLVLTVVLIVALIGWAFIALTDEVREGDTQRTDERILRMLRKPDDPGALRGPHWLFESIRDITSLGSVTVLVLVVLAVVIYFLMVRKYRALWLVLGATVGGLALGSALKHVFARERPHVVPHLQNVGTASFPSGHSMYSAIVYLTLASLLSTLVPERRAKVYFVIVALILTFLVGISRIALGVHYPTDVVAGWCAGLVWSLICWLIARYLQRQGAVEQDTETKT